jgi:hypothetical protein
VVGVGFPRGGPGVTLAHLYGLRSRAPDESKPAAAATIGTPPAQAQIESLGSPVASSDRTTKAEAAHESTAEATKRFVTLLKRFRQNDASVLPSLRESAEILCAVHRRCESRQILDVYESMSAEDRAEGYQAEIRFREIVTEVRNRYLEADVDEEQDVLREEALRDLDEIAKRSLALPDVFPGACAASFRARLQTDRLLSDYSLDAEDRLDLITQASADAEASLAAFERFGMLTPRLEPMWISGYLRAANGDTHAARRAFDDCLALARRLELPEWQEKAYEGLIDLAREAGDTREIAALLEEISRSRSPKDSWYLVREQAMLLLQQDFAESAARFLLDHPPADPRPRHEWNVLLGSAFLRQGQLDLAREQYAQAESMPFTRDVALAMASIDLASGNATRVLDQLSKREFRAGLYPYEETLALQLSGEAALEVGKFEEAAGLLDRALAIGGELQGRLGPERDLVGAATSVVGERVGLHALTLLARCRAALGQPLEAARSIEHWQSRSLRGNARADLTTENLLAWARSTPLGLVTWVVGADASVVAHVAPDGSAEVATIHRGRKAIEAAVRRLSEAVIGRDAAFTQRLAAQVRAEILPESILARLAPRGGARAERLLVLAHGPIERLPIEFLLRDDPVIPLVLPGLPSAEPGEAPDAAAWTRWTLLGSPVDTEGTPLLPGASEELATIAALREGGGRNPSVSESASSVVQAREPSSTGLRLRVGSAFDRESFIAALKEGRAIHVATHLRRGCGRSEGRLEDVGLQISGNEVLCAREIAELAPALPIAVLAACETAEGRFLDAEGLQGVARAFLESGTRNLVVTLWPVADEPARAFAVAFHRALLDGDQPSGAVARARATVRDLGFGPADWAAFRALGRD